jgi:hypothetical protein
MLITESTETSAGQYISAGHGRAVRAGIRDRLAKRYEALTGDVFISWEHDIEFSIQTTGEKWTVICSGTLKSKDHDLEPESVSDLIGV